MNTDRRTHGFTLIELMVTVTLVGIMAGLAIAGARQMTPRLRATRSIADLVAIFRQAPRLAAASNADLWLGLEDPNSGTSPYHYVLIQDWNGNFDRAGFDPANPRDDFDDDGGKRTDRLLTKGEIYESVKYYRGTDVKGPSMNEIPGFYRPVVLATQPRCTTYGFSATGCPVTGSNQMTWIRFKANGEVEVPGNGNARFISLILGRSNLEENSEKTIIVVSLPYGLVEIFHDA
ncbi:MAG: prepilin-type N-terminal cleavage/methylation domain-containing protein [Deltaproteobacteria bacterium]|nr:prepilin-type N-terminal cleavage/methylation domain-containing protein [Deltaproteobacteria bacterium]